MLIIYFVVYVHIFGVFTK